MKNIISALLVLILLVTLSPHTQQSDAGGWLKHDCPDQEMKVFLEEVRSLFELLIPIANGMRFVGDVQYFGYMTNQELMLGMYNIMNSAHVIDEMSKPDCYDATQVVNTYYWMVTAMAEAYFGVEVGNDDYLQLAEERIEAGENAMSIIVKEYGIMPFFE